METYLAGFRFYKAELETLEKFLERNGHPVELVVSSMLMNDEGSVMDEVFCEFYGPDGYPIHNLLNEYLRYKTGKSWKAID